MFTKSYFKVRVTELTNGEKIVFDSLNVVNPGNGNIPDLIVTVTHYPSYLIVTKLNGTKKFINEIGELRAVSGHMLGAFGVQIPQNNLDNLQSIRKEDGTLEIEDSPVLVGSNRLDILDSIIFYLLLEPTDFGALGLILYTIIP
ncbi:hypothetical protein Tco_0548596 [Tanacetum coccineum]